MAKTKITLYLGEQDELIQKWYQGIPTRYRSMMVRLAIYNALKHGLADVEQLFPGMTVPTPPRETTDQKAHQVKADSPAVGPSSAELKQGTPENMTREELVAFTVANLPPDTPPHLVELAKQYSSRTPYTLERLQMLHELQVAGADPASTST